MKKSLLLFVLALLPIVASAVEFTDANGIIYELVGKGTTRVAKVKGATAALKATKVLNIPSTVSDGTDTYTVTTICGSSFVGDAGNLLPLDQVTIPATITAIEDNAFMMSDIKILNVEDLEAWCKITITSPNEWISYATYIYPKQFSVKGTIVKDLVIPSSITSIGKGLFRGFKCFDSVTIPGNVETIGDYAFSFCSMSSLSLGEGISSIGTEAFSYCENLSSVIIPKSCGNYGDGMFLNCENLTSVEIKGNIGINMFKDCANLTNLTLNTNTSEISSGAFSGTGLVSVIIPHTVHSISNGAFGNCSKLRTVTIKYDSNDSGSYLGMGLGGISFGNCPLLENFYCEVPFNSMSVDNMMSPFENSYVNEGATLHVPSADVTSYQTTDPWSLFSNVVALSGTTPPGPTATKCDKPTISYNSATGTIDFTCSTAGVDFVSSVTSEDIKSYSTASITLTQKYTISVYATKAGMDNSDTATMDIIITGTGQAIVVGDMDGNGTLNATDIVKLVNKIMGK